MNRTINYGWDSDEGPHSCVYLTPVVLSWLCPLHPKKVLDLGAGNGALCRALVAAGYEVVGVEPDVAGVNIARQHCPQAHFYQLSVDDDPSLLLRDYPGGFDAVISTEVVEHLYAPRRLPAFAHAVLREGGLLLLTTPYHGYLKNLVISIIGGWDHHLDPLWDGGHIKQWGRSTITRLVREAGFEVQRFGGVGRVPWLWKSMLVLAVKT